MKKIFTEISQITIDKDCIIHIPKIVYELNSDEIFTIKNIPDYLIDIYSAIINEKHEKNVKPFCWRVSSFGQINNLIIVETSGNLIFIYTVSEKVIDFSMVRYSIDYISKPENIHLKTLKIIKYPIGVPDCGDETFRSINELKLKSPIYRSLTEYDKNKVCNPKNIETAEHFFHSKIFNDLDNTAKFLHHLYLGNIKNGKYSGIHHIYPILKGVAKLEEIIDKPNINGVWRGKVSLKDRKSNFSSEYKEWKHRDEPATFFPNKWNNIMLIEECEYAFNNKKLKEQRKNIIIWNGQTISGINVEIMTDLNNNLISIYPDWEKEKSKLSV